MIKTDFCKPYEFAMDELVTEFHCRNLLDFLLLIQVHVMMFKYLFKIIYDYSWHLKLVIWNEMIKIMHSSRMRTAQSLTISHSIQWGGVCPTPPDADPLDADPPPYEQNDTKTLPCPKLRLRAVNSPPLKENQVSIWMQSNNEANELNNENKFTWDVQKCWMKVRQCCHHAVGFW